MVESIVCSRLDNCLYLVYELDISSYQFKLFEQTFQTLLLVGKLPTITVSFGRSESKPGNVCYSVAILTRFDFLFYISCTEFAFILNAGALIYELYAVIGLIGSIIISSSSTLKSSERTGFSR